MSTTNTPPPEITVRFLPFAVTAKGKEAVNAVKYPLAIAIVLRAFFVGLSLGVAAWCGWPLIKLIY